MSMPTVHVPIAIWLVVRWQWRAALADRPADGFGPPGRRPGEERQFTVDGLHRITRATGATMFMVLQAAAGRVLSRHGFGEVIPFGAMAAGRTRTELTDLVGCFANRLVLRTDVRGDPRLSELIDRIRPVDLAAFDHADLPTGRWPRAMIVHHEQARLSTVDGLTGRLEPVPTGTVPADVTLAFYEPPVPGPVRCVLSFATAALDPARAESIVADLITTVAQFDKECTPDE